MPRKSFFPVEMPIISEQTGLISVRVQTANGIEITALMNSNIKIGQVIQIDATVNRFRNGLDFDSNSDLQSRGLLESSLKISGAGHYYVMCANHCGDTRGQNWYTDLVCLAVDATIPINITPRGAVLPEAAIKRY